MALNDIHLFCGAGRSEVKKITPKFYNSFSKANGKANFIKATSKCFVLFCRARTGKFKSDFKIL